MDVPRHIAFIMDGNGRWARSRGLERVRGHEQGANVLREVTRRCGDLGVREVTFFALSTENYRMRPRHEIHFLMQLLRKYLIAERKEIAERDIRLCSIGRIDELPADVVRELRTTESLSRDGSGMVMRLALNYGGRGEILDALSAIARDIVSGRRKVEDFIDADELTFASYLYDPEMTEPDLLVRTAGEQRVSNFLLWQISYTELWVTDATWPEFTAAHLDAALEAFRRRERKFGGVEGRALSPRDGKV